MSVYFGLRRVYIVTSTICMKIISTCEAFFLFLFTLQFEFECDNELGSQECTDFDTSIPDVGMMSEGEAEMPAISVIRLSATSQSGTVAKESDAINEDTGVEKDSGSSPAAVRAENLAAGVILASAFSLALV
mmetsp:Transcript_32050/g.67188  ORF Transcript_32050/g.67188 Transcript_32050/m.67188 type:complete len:132 (+) Transcript_32050:924-1319(+)